MVKTIDIQEYPHAYELSAPTDAAVVLVFVHGWLLSRAYWQPLIEQLCPTYQCLTYDLRGFGHSQPRPIASGLDQTLGEDSRAPEVMAVEAIAPKRATAVAEKAPAGLAPTQTTTQITTPIDTTDLTWPLDPSSRAPQDSAQYNPAAYAQDLNLLLHQLGIRKAWLVGHSLGGSIALWAADQSPQTVAGVICVNSGGGIYLKEEFERFRTAGQALVKFRPRWLSYLPLLELPLARMNVARPLALTWGKQRLMDLLAAQPDAALGALLQSTTEAEVHQLPQVVARLQQPVHFIAGANDTMMEPKYVHHLASFHPSFEYCGNNVSEIADCGHLSMVEQPEAVAAEISAILAKHLT